MIGWAYKIMGIMKRFDLTGKNALITGGAGLLAGRHAEALLSAGACCVLVDIDQMRLARAVEALVAKWGTERVVGKVCDITCKSELLELLKELDQQVGSIDILINNAALNPKVQADNPDVNFSRFENFPLDQWERELSVGLLGSMLCCQVFGAQMAARGQGVILNIASDLAVIAPDQRIYRQAGIADSAQPVKPVTYSVIKSGLIGLTRYLATYWADSNVRVNALSPGGVYDGQPEEFVSRLTHLIPMGRMARQDEYQAAVLFLVSDASSYMTGFNMVMDGGRSCW